MGLQYDDVEGQIVVTAGGKRPFICIQATEIPRSAMQTLGRRFHNLCGDLKLHELANT